jgi:hypothetical protein
MTARSDYLVVTLTALTLATAGCGNWQGKSSDPPARRAPVEETGFALRGMDGSVWESACIAGSEKKESARIVWTMADLTMEKLTSYFHGTDCAAAGMYAQRGIGYEQVRVSDHSDRIAGSLRVRSRVTAVTFAPTEEAFAATMNAESAYGFTDWTTSVFKDVSGLTWESGSQAEPKKGKSLSLVYKIEGDTMWFAWNNPDGSWYFDTNEPFFRQ